MPSGSWLFPVGAAVANSARLERAMVIPEMRILAFCAGCLKYPMEIWGEAKKNGIEE